eukprot:906704-Pyramimonas_sp.AAC.1
MKSRFHLTNSHAKTWRKVILVWNMSEAMADTALQLSKPGPAGNQLALQSGSIGHDTREDARLFRWHPDPRTAEAFDGKDARSPLIWHGRPTNQLR